MQEEKLHVENGGEISGSGSRTTIAIDKIDAWR